MQKYEDVKHQDVKMYCATTQFPELPFCVPHNKPHYVRGLNNHDQIFF